MASMAIGSGAWADEPASRNRMLAAPTPEFEAWLAKTKSPVPDFDQMRSFAGLPPLLEFYDGRPVRTSGDWQARRAELRRLLGEYFLGAIPTDRPKVQSAKVLNEIREGGSISQEIELTFATNPPVSVNFEWMRPDRPGKLPVLFTQTNHRRWGLIALARGYAVCVYPGSDVDDQSDKFLPVYPDCDWARLARRAWLASRILDYVLTLPEVDPTAIGITGHSRNGKQSLIAGALDERFTAVVSSSSGVGGAVSYRFGSERAFDESVEFMTRSNTTASWFSQRLRLFTGREHKLPVDNHALLGLIAPRPVLISTAYHDGCDQTFGAEQTYLAAREAYRFLKKPEALRILWRPGNHEVANKDIEAYMDWFDAAFGRAKHDLPEVLLHHFDWEQWRKESKIDVAPIPAKTADAKVRIAWALGEEPPRQPTSAGTYGHTPPHIASMLGRGGEAGQIGRLGLDFGDYVAGEFYYPKNAKGPVPVVVWLHPYSYNYGYSGAYSVGQRIQNFLVSKGVAVLAFDQIGFGSRLLESQDFYDRYPRWSRLGKMVRDVRSAVDFLSGIEHRRPDDGAALLPAIDAKRIFLLGYSLGGTVALHAAALDDRVAGVACFSGFTPLRTDTDAKPTGGIRRLWQWHALQPQLGLFAGREAEIPYDYDDLLRRIAPRRCLIVAPQHDRDADAREVTACVESVRWGKLQFEMPDDYNRFQSPQQELFWKWFEGK